MPLKYACFISYRRYEENELSDNFVEGLYKALKNEIDFKVGPKRVFLDVKSGMAPGSLLPESLSRHICESACLVVVYNADYFSRDSTWCTREFKAMLELEKLRFDKLAKEERTEGFLVIIVLRDRESLPQIFIKNRLVCFFDDWTLYQPEIPKHPGFYPEVMKMAKYIAARFNALRNLEANPAADPCAACDKYCLPTEAAALTWLDDIQQTTGKQIQEEYADEFPR